MKKCNKFFELHLKLIDIKAQKLNYNLIVMGEKI
jgi:EXS family